MFLLLAMSLRAVGARFGCGRVLSTTCNAIAGRYRNEGIQSAADMWGWLWFGTTQLAPMDAEGGMNNV